MICCSFGRQAVTDQFTQLRKLKSHKEKGIVDINLYRGKRYEDFLKLSLKEILQHMSGKVRRYYEKGLKGSAAILFNKLLVLPENESVRTHVRDFYILPIHTGRIIEVYNGKSFIPVKITLAMSGFKLGEFAITRTPPSHKSPGIGATRSSKARASAKT